MARIPITVMGYRCERCDHEWIPRGDVADDPRVCPKCKSPYWNRPRKMSYDQFRGTIEAVLIAARQPLTWTEIRTRGNLTQMYPNNQWVHRMEQDIQLVRQRDKDGVIHWQLLNDEQAVETSKPKRARAVGTKSALE